MNILLIVIGLLALAIWIPFMWIVIWQRVRYNHKMYRN